MQTSLRLLSRMKIEGVTVHGFRSAFRDWAAEHESPAMKFVKRHLPM